MAEETDESLTRVCANLDKMTHNAVVAFADQVFWRIDHRTPVDTGRARGNWMAGLDAPNTDVDVNRFDPAGDSTCANAHEVFDKFKLGQAIFITNGLPYIMPLEHGHSQKAPEGMIAVTVAEMPMIAEEIARQGADTLLHGNGPIEGNQMVMQGGE